MPPLPITENTEPKFGYLNANISMPVSKPSRPVAVISSKLAKDDQLNKRTQFDQLTKDIQSQRDNVSAMLAQKKKQQQIQELTARTPVDPTQQIDDILKNLTNEI